MCTFAKMLFLLTIVSAGAANGKKDQCLLQMPTAKLHKTIGENSMGDTEVQAVQGPSDINIDHAHIVCHSTSCEEAQAKLTAIEGRMAIAKEKLQACSSKRAKLQGDLKAAKAAREEVEEAVAECHSTREELQLAVDECARNRAEKTEALEECKTTRAALEAELKQCVEFDRPSAEKALAECIKERGALEAELEALGGAVEEDEPSGGKSGGKKGGKGSKAALAQVDSEQHVSMKADAARIQSRIQELNQQEDSHVQKLEGLTDKIGKLVEKIIGEDDKFDEIVAGLEEHFVTEAGLMEEFEQNDRKIVDATKAYLEQVAGPLSQIKEGLKESSIDQGEGLADLAGEVESQAAATLELLELKAEFNDARHEEAKANNLVQKSEVKRLQALLEQKTKDGANEECEELRGQLVTAEASLAETEGLLKECLMTKKELIGKIEKAQEASALAKKALAKCIASKAKLSAALEDCQQKCAELSALLKNCLKAKEELKAAVEECHKKRDAAKAALAECLKKKEELKGKIEALKGGKLLQLEDHRDFLQQSQAMEPLVFALQSLKKLFFKAIKEQRSLDDDTQSIMARITDLTNVEFGMESAADAADSDASTILKNTLNDGLDAVMEGVAAMHNVIEAATATNERVMQDLQ